MLGKPIQNTLMHIEFAAADEQYIKDSVKYGYYRSEAEAVRDAVRRAREEAERRHERLMDALRRGEADIIAGKVSVYTPDLFGQIRRDARQHEAEGRKPKPDVL